MPDFWEFPTVSMGLGPMNAIYQARFNRYLHDRGIKDTTDQHVWAFLGDGEMDEPESARRDRASPRREELDNLIFVVNCNLQRLDGPVRGNGKIIQELEPSSAAPAGTSSRSSGAATGTPCWHADTDGVLVNKMNTTPDGQYQTYRPSSPAPTCASTSSAATRGCARWSSDLTDDEIRGPPARRPRLPQGLRGVQAPPSSTWASRP